MKRDLIKQMAVKCDQCRDKEEVRYVLKSAPRVP